MIDLLRAGVTNTVPAGTRIITSRPSSVRPTVRLDNKSGCAREEINFLCICIRLVI